MSQPARARARTHLQKAGEGLAGEGTVLGSLAEGSTEPGPQRAVKSLRVQLRVLATQAHAGVAMELMSPEVWVCFCFVLFCFLFVFLFFVFFNLEKTVFNEKSPCVQC